MRDWGCHEGRGGGGHTFSRLTQQAQHAACPTGTRVHILLNTKTHTHTHTHEKHDVVPFLLWRASQAVLECVSEPLFHTAHGMEQGQLNTDQLYLSHGCRLLECKLLLRNRMRTGTGMVSKTITTKGVACSKIDPQRSAKTFGVWRGGRGRGVRGTAGQPPGTRGVVKQRILSYHMTPVTQAIRSSLFQVQC